MHPLRGSCYKCLRMRLTALRNMIRLLPYDTQTRILIIRSLVFAAADGRRQLPDRLRKRVLELQEPVGHLWCVDDAPAVIEGGHFEAVDTAVPVGYADEEAVALRGLDLLQLEVEGRRTLHSEPRGIRVHRSVCLRDGGLAAGESKQLFESQPKVFSVNR
jgi:hypothetical protein